MGRDRAILEADTAGLQCLGGGWQAWAELCPWLLDRKKGLNSVRPLLHCTSPRKLCKHFLPQFPGLCISEHAPCVNICKSSSNTYVLPGDLLTPAGRPGKPQQEASRRQAGIWGLMDDVCNLDTISLQSCASHHPVSFLWSLQGLLSARPIVGRCHPNWRFYLYGLTAFTAAQ